MRSALGAFMTTTHSFVRMRSRDQPLASKRWVGRLGTLGRGCLEGDDEHEAKAARAHPPSGTSLKSSPRQGTEVSLQCARMGTTTEASAITLIHHQSDRGGALQRFLRMRGNSATYNEFPPVSVDGGTLVPSPQLRLISAFPEGREVLHTPTVFEDASKLSYLHRVLFRELGKGTMPFAPSAAVPFQACPPA